MGTVEQLRDARSEHAKVIAKHDGLDEALTAGELPEFHPQ